MRTCQVITDGETALGFRLAGVEAFAAADGPAAERLVVEILDKRECGLLLIREDLLEGVGVSVTRRLEREGLPIVIPLPPMGAWQEEEKGLAYVLRLIRRSIGYSMRIRA